MTGSASGGICVVAYCARCAAEAIPLALEVDLAQATTNCLEEVCASLSRAMEVARTVLEWNTGLASAVMAACDVECIIIWSVEG